MLFWLFPEDTYFGSTIYMRTLRYSVGIHIELVCVCFHFIMNSSPHERHDEWNGTENSLFSFSGNAATNTKLHCTLISSTTSKRYFIYIRKNWRNILIEKFGYFGRENKNMCSCFENSHSTEKMHKKVRGKR